MATTSIAKASLLLSADGGALNSGLDSASQALTQWGAKTTSLLGGLGPAGIAAAVALGGVAIAIGAVIGTGIALKAVFDEMSEKITTASKAAREMGVDLQGFTALQYAAKVSGVEVSDLQGALTQLRTNLIQADAPAERLFGQLGLQVADLRRLPVDEAVTRIATALNGIADPTERARLSLAVFGDKAVQIQQLLARGGDGIKALADEARKAGITFNEVDAAKIRQANEALTRMGTALEGIKTQLAIWMAPFVEGIAEAVRSWGGLKDDLDSGSTTFTSLADTATDALRAVAVGVAYMWDAWKKFAAWVAENIDAPLLRWYGTVADIVTNVVGILKEELQPAWENIVAGWSAAMEQVNALLAGLQSLWTDVSSSVINAANGIRDAILNGIRNALGAFGIDADAVFQRVQDAIGYVVSRIRVLAEVIRRVWAALTRRTSTGDAFRSAADNVENVGRTLGRGRFGDSAEAVNRFFDNLSNRNRQVTDEVANSNPIDAVRAKILQGINDLEKEIRKTIATVGFTGPESRIFDLEQQGATPEQLAGVRELANQAKNVEAAWSTIQLPPFDLWQRQVAGLDQLLESGRLTWDQYAQGIANASRQIMQAAGLGEIKTVSAQLKGSSAATSSIIKAELQNKIQNDPAAELRRALIESREIQRQQLGVAQELLGEIRRQGQAAAEEVI